MQKILTQRHGEPSKEKENTETCYKRTFATGTVGILVARSFSIGYWGTN